MWCFILHLFWNLNIVLQRRMHKTHVLSLKIHNKTIYPTEVKTIYLTEVKKENITGTLEATLRLPLCPLRPSLPTRDDHISEICSNNSLTFLCSFPSCIYNLKQCIRPNHMKLNTGDFMWFNLCIFSGGSIVLRGLKLILGWG